MLLIPEFAILILGFFNFLKPCFSQNIKLNTKCSTTKSVLKF